MGWFILVELEAEKKKVEDMIAELEERKKREEEQKNPTVRFCEIYEKNIGSKVYYFIMKQEKSYLRNMISNLLFLFCSYCIL